MLLMNILLVLSNEPVFQNIKDIIRCYPFRIFYVDLPCECCTMTCILKVKHTSYCMRRQSTVIQGCFSIVPSFQYDIFQGICYTILKYDASCRPLYLLDAPSVWITCRMSQSLPIFTLCFSSSRRDSRQSETTSWERCCANGQSLNWLQNLGRWVKICWTLILFITLGNICEGR